MRRGISNLKTRNFSATIRLQVSFEDVSLAKPVPAQQEPNATHLENSSLTLLMGLHALPDTHAFFRRQVKRVARLDVKGCVPGIQIL